MGKGRAYYHKDTPARSSSASTLGSGDKLSEGSRPRFVLRGTLPDSYHPA
jgi:hypothetical protein